MKLKPLDTGEENFFFKLPHLLHPSYATSVLRVVSWIYPYLSASLKSGPISPTPEIKPPVSALSSLFPHQSINHNHAKLIFQEWLICPAFPPFENLPQKTQVQ